TAAERFSVTPWSAWPQPVTSIGTSPQEHQLLSRNENEMSGRICLITPGHLSRNPRLVKEADALTEAGYDVAVIAADFSQWGRYADAEFRDRRWQVVASPRFGPLAPIHKRILEWGRRTAARFLVGKCKLRYPFVVRAACHPIAPELLSSAKS